MRVFISMKIGTAIMIFFLAIIALVAEFFLSMIFGLGAAFSGDRGSITTTSFIFSSLIIMSVAAGILAPISAVIGIATKNNKLSIKLYLWSLLIVFIGVILFSVISVNKLNQNININKQDSSKNSQNQNREVDIKVLQKEFVESDWQDQIVIDFEFINNTSKNIKAVKGTIAFFDTFGDEILSSTLKYDNIIPASATAEYKTGIDYNQFMDSHQRLKDIKLDNLKYTWKAEQIIYE